MKYYFQVEVTDKTYDRLKNLRGAGYVHSIFEHTVNILMDGESLYTLADETLNNGPNCLKVKNFKVSELNLQVNDEAYFFDNKLVINNKMIVDYQSVNIIHYKQLSYPIDKVLLKEKANSVENSQWVSDLLGGYAEQSFQSEVLKTMERQSYDLEHALIVGDKRKISSYLKKFIGLGIGLTPSGDDFLTGLAYVSSLDNYPNTLIKDALNKLETHVKRRTNVISYSQYHKALNAEARREVIDSVNALLNNLEYEIVEKSVKEILSVGSSSGFDLLKGILFGLKIS